MGATTTATPMVPPTITVGLDMLNTPHLAAGAPSPAGNDRPVKHREEVTWGVLHFLWP